MPATRSEFVGKLLAAYEEPLPRRELLSLNAEIVGNYAKRGNKTVTRDLNALVRMGLVIEQDNRYFANTDLIIAFLPERAPTAAQER